MALANLWHLRPEKSIKSFKLQLNVSVHSVIFIQIVSASEITSFLQICVARLPKLQRHLSLLRTAHRGAAPSVAACGAQTSTEIILVSAELQYMRELFRVSTRDVPFS